MAKPRQSMRSQQIAAYQNTSSGVPIKVMTVALISLTAGFAYDLYQKKKFPHQHGVSLIGGIRDWLSRW